MSTLEPGEKIKPNIDIDSAEKLVDKLFNFKVIKIIEIDSYDDRNYLIEIESDFHDHGKKFVLKITNSLDSSFPRLIEAVNEITNYVKSSTSLKVPYPIPDCNGQLVSRISLNSSLPEEQFAIRLLNFVPGTIMNQVDYTENILFQVGETLATLTKELKNFTNSVLEKRKTIWSLSSVDKLDKFLFAVDNDDHRSLISGVIKKFKQQVIDKIDEFPVSIIHGDVNEQNIVLDKVDTNRWSVIGLIDFADSHQAPTIFDLAILCCYVTLDSKLIDPIKAPGYVISGYHRVIQISDQEWNILPISIMARLAQSLTLGAYSYRENQGNEYILSSARRAGQFWKD
ncbi:hydroxylysine kinase-like [Panonychus citri]|uniref:hydroxylysine kinase-like n=1 Tax=Panonychus citri TaxID=50023 RepID=UPI002308349E|nr:hydroxylysine kinase-like [Panonychus citri]